MDGNVSFKKGLTARELRRNAHRRGITKIRKEDKAKAQGEPSSRPRCLGALRSPENSESTKRKKTAKSLATKKPRMDNPDNSVSFPSANVFSTALESDITQLDDRFDVSCQKKLAQSGEQLLKMIVDVATIFNDIPSSCYPENENAKGASWAERMENMDSLWEGVRESVYNSFLSKQAYPLKWAYFVGSYFVRSYLPGLFRRGLFRPVLYLRQSQAKAVVSAGAVAGLISMFCSLDRHVAEGAGYCLAEIASERQELREEIIKPLLTLIKPDTPVTLLQRVTNALSIFCQFIKKNPPTFILPALAHLLHNNDETIITEACYAFTFCSQGSDEVIEEVVNAGVVPRLVALLQHREVAIVPCPNHCPIFSILKTIGNITSGTFDQAKAVVSAGAVTPLISFLGSHRDVAEAALFALSNIADFGPELRNCVIEQGIIRPLLSLIKLDITPDITSLHLRRMVTWTLCSLCHSHEDSPLTVPVIQQLLTGLAHLSHHNNDGYDNLFTACEAFYGLEKNIVENKKAAAIESDIAALNALSSKTLAILERYLSTELSNGESKLPSTS